MGLRRRWAGAVLLCACRAAAEEQGLRRAGKERVLGVGLGVFLLSFFFIAMCALCWAGALNLTRGCFPELSAGRRGRPRLGATPARRRAGAAPTTRRRRRAAATAPPPPAPQVLARVGHVRRPRRQAPDEAEPLPPLVVGRDAVAHARRRGPPAPRAGLRRSARGAAPAVLRWGLRRGRGPAARNRGGPGGLGGFWRKRVGRGAGCPSRQPGRVQAGEKDTQPLFLLVCAKILPARQGHRDFSQQGLARDEAPSAGRQERRRERCGVARREGPEARADAREPRRHARRPGVAEARLRRELGAGGDERGPLGRVPAAPAAGGRSRRRGGGGASSARRRRGGERASRRDEDVRAAPRTARGSSRASGSARRPSRARTWR